MPPTRLSAVLVAVGAASMLAACGSGGSSASGQSATTTTPTAPAAPPTGTAPGGSAPGASSTPTHTPTGAYTLSSGRRTTIGRTYVASAADQSAVLVTGGARLRLVRPTVKTTGDSSSSDESSFYGLDAGLLANAKGRIAVAGGSVHTSGDGANGIFAYGSGALVDASRLTISATGQYAHGAMTSGGGALVLRRVNIRTAGASSAAVATDRGGGTVSATGGRWITTGNRSPGIYSTGHITVTGATIDARGAEGAVIEGANAITATGTAITAAVDRGVMLYQSMSGDANAGTGRYTMRGGSLRARSGPAFYVTNTNAAITVGAGATVTAASGVLLRADANGTGSGNTGAGNVTFRASRVTLRGNVSADAKSTVALTLGRASRLTGAITHAALTLAGSGRWTVAGNSALTTLAGATITGTTVTNINGSGHTVTYDAGRAANDKLGGKTYALTGGGTLKPA